MPSMWLWCGFGVALVWLWCGFEVALGWLCTPEYMPSICLVYGFAVASGGLPVPLGEINATWKARSDNYAVPLVLGDFERGRLAVDNFIRSSYILLSIQSSMTGLAITRAVSAIRRQAQRVLGAMLVL